MVEVDVLSNSDNLLNTSGINPKVVGKTLNDQSKSLAVRFRALFVLRNLKCDESVKQIAAGFNDSSELLKHELAYCLGQMQNLSAVPYLIQILEDKTQAKVVRHEAGEALGALGDFSVLEVLRKHSNDSIQEVAETCQLAVKRLEWLQENQSNSGGVTTSVFNSIDPVPAATHTNDIKELTSILCDDNCSLWDRYRAMFALRNIWSTNSEDERAVKAIAQGLKCVNSGVLFRHEIAYVLGQIQSPASVKELSKSLQNEEEDAIVRHESAEALGSIGTDECMKLIRQYANDKERIVRESCEVALDMAEYEQSNEFQYAKVN